MNISARVVRFDEDAMLMDLAHGRTIGVPIAWFPRLLDATPIERARLKISASGQGLHWEQLDEDIFVPGLLAAHGDMTRNRAATA